MGSSQAKYVYSLPENSPQDTFSVLVAATTMWNRLDVVTSPLPPVTPSVTHELASWHKRCSVPHSSVG